MKAEEKRDNYKPVIVKRFTPDEDQIIMLLAKPDADNDWFKISKSLRNRTARQCRDRWNNYLNPNLNKNEWSPEDDELLLNLYHKKGPQWKSFCSILNGRSINDVRNRCFRLIRKIQKTSKSSTHTKKDVEKKVEDAADFANVTVPFDVGNFKMNIFDNEIFSNFDSLGFDIDELIQAFD